MRLSSLCVATVFLFSSLTFAQHSSGGGGSSGGSSGGGSHGGSSGGSSSASSSGGSHTSGGTSSSSSAHSSGGSGSHGSSAHSSASPSSHANANTSHPNTVHSVREPNNVRARTETTEKKSFFSFLRHPFRKPEPKPEPKKLVADLRRPVCLKGPCPVCPVGQARIGGACTGTAAVNNNTRRYCSSGEIWNGGACLQQTRFLDDCAGLRMTLQQQAQRMQSAESVRQSACAAGPTQSCTDLTNAAQSESGLYRTLEERYRTCMQRPMSAYPFGNFGFRGYSGGAAFEPWQMELSFP